MLEAKPGGLADPPPEALVEELGESNVVIRYLGWVDKRAADFLCGTPRALAGRFCRRCGKLR